MTIARENDRMKEFLGTLELNRIYQFDCIDGMRLLPEESVDLCVTDPPYKLTSGGCRGGLKIEFNQVTKEEKETGKFFEIPKFSDWIPEVYRILKDGSHFYCMCNDKNLKELLIEGEKAGFKELNILVWDKGMHTPLGYYMKNVEFIVLFRKGQAVKINNMGSKALISIKGIRGNKVHPSEKPVELMKHLIENSTTENDIVIDPFMGSGTVAVSSKENKRRFVGFEVESKYIEIINQRLESTYNENDDEKLLK
jgi:site-specific DNA-methyltransferase (adenine-specific)